MTQPNAIADANDFLFGGGTPSAKFPQIGATVSGIIAGARKTQQTDFKTKLPKTFTNGDPMMQLVVTLTGTGQYDPTIPNDDGTRAVYIKGAQMTDAVRTAVTQAGAAGLDVGGRLTLQYVGDGVPSEPGLNPPKHYAVAYQPPSPVADAAGFLAPQNGGAVAPQQQFAPVPQAQPQPNYGYLPPQQPQPFQAPPAPTMQPVQYQQPVAPQIPGVQQMIPQAPPVAQAPAVNAAGRTPEQQAAIDALDPAARAALGL